MYNDKIRGFGAPAESRGRAGIPTGRSHPAFLQRTMASEDPSYENAKPKRLCDGSLPDDEDKGQGVERPDYGRGLTDRPLAMVYSPYQEFKELYEPEMALERGTLFAELDLPFEGYKNGGLWK